MVARWSRIVPQPLVAAVLTLLATGLIGAAWAITGPRRIPVEQVLLALGLVLAVVASYQFPIHVGFRHKVEMTTVPLYLLTVLLTDVALVVTTVGVAMLAGELMVRGRRGNYYSDVLTAAARWVIIAGAGTLVAHLNGAPQVEHLLATAVVLWLGEWLTVPLLVGPAMGTRPFRVLVGMLPATASIEGVQYLLGILGSLAAAGHVWAVGLLVLPTALVYQAFKSAREMQVSTRQMLEHLADTVDLRDPCTGGHSRRVAAVTGQILEEMALRGPEADLILAAARVHDIGKIGIPDSILNKPGTLSVEERAIMQSHAEQGAALLARYPNFARGAQIVRHHHEAWDGSGYPHQLRGTEIPFGARVIAVADTFDSMTSDRPYRVALSIEKAASILRRGRGQQWDPQVVDAFLRTVADQLPETPVLHLLRPAASTDTSVAS